MVKKTNMTLRLNFIILFVIVYGISQAQNLVPNPSFEQETIIKVDSKCKTYSFPHWDNLKKDGCGIERTCFFDFREYLS